MSESANYSQSHKKTQKKKKYLPKIENNNDDGNSILSEKEASVTQNFIGN